MLNGLFSGNSNTIGRGTGGANFTGVSSLVKFWNNDNNSGTELSNGTAWIAPVIGANPFDTNEAGNNFCVWMADAIARYLNVPVNAVVAAEGAVPIQAWEPSWSGPGPDAYAHVLGSWRATGLGPADFLTWDSSINNAAGYLYNGHDYSMTQSQFHDAVLALRTRLIGDGVLHPRGQILMPGFIATGCGDLEAAFSQLQDEQPDIFHYVYATDLAGFDTPPKHFSGPSLVTLGGRMFDAYCSHMMTSLPEEQTPNLRAILAAKAKATLDAID